MNSSQSGISLVGLLGVAFVVLKLCHVINWSWWLVTLPFWAEFAVAVVVALVFILVVAVRHALDR